MQHVKPAWASIPAPTEASIDRLGREYEEMVCQSDNPTVRHAWDYAGRALVAAFEHIRHTTDTLIVFTEVDPYPDFNTMLADYRINNTLCVYDSDATGPHPVWDRETNNAFRAVHDLWGHIRTGGDFSAHGEYLAYLGMVEFGKISTATIFRSVMKTEILGQFGYTSRTGKYEDKIGFLDTTVRFNKEKS